jgi:SAM-dependent methyltransferase
VAKHLGASNRFYGFGIEYLLPAGDVVLHLQVDDRPIHAITVSVPADAGGRQVFSKGLTLNRDQVYATALQSVRYRYQALHDDGHDVWPPVELELLELLKGCEEPVLDFGCGGGLLIQDLRSKAVDAHGLDLCEMRPFLLPEVRDRITLYDGVYPSPLESGSFATVVSAESLEHIRDYRAAVAEMARLTRGRLIISVPDHNLVQLCEYSIPKHYLVGDHYNFFNQGSLIDLLQPLFRSVKIARTSLFQIEGMPVYGSLLADCHK